MFYNNMASGDRASAMLEIDVSIMEGGGQILRIATALSCLTKTPIQVEKIRAGRSNPGLRPQHLCGIKLVSDICGGRLMDATEGSTCITLYPGQINSGKYEADTKTAGSVCLLLQVALPCLLFTETTSHLTLFGGTDADMAPPIDYFNMVLSPILKRSGVNFTCTVDRRGYYPRGGGRVRVDVEPLARAGPAAACIHPIVMSDRGRVTHITGRSYVAGTLPHRLCGVMRDCARDVLLHSDGISLTHNDIHIDLVHETQQTAHGNGSGIFLLAHTDTGCILAGSALGRRGRSAEDVGRSAAEELVSSIISGGCVDQHLQDQLIIFMALAHGKSMVRCGEVTEHTRTAIYISELMTKAKFTITPSSSVEGTNSKSNVIECKGIGFGIL